MVVPWTRWLHCWREYLKSKQWKAKSVNISSGVIASSHGGLFITNNKQQAAAHSAGEELTDRLALLQLVKNLGAECLEILGTVQQRLQCQTFDATHI